ncbi:MAG: FtsQ-type POTRA domain-containing protein [Chloroflexota bacterium]|nr:FtsQ-type POTRA domain-containing protein [Chloroflexota bacterium]
MVSHVQIRKRQPDRRPGVLHHAPAGAKPERQTAIRNERGQTHLRWCITSGVLFVIFGLILVLFFSSDLFYVRSVQVRGNDFLAPEEVFAFSSIADFHMFWLDPEEIRRNVLRSSSIADVTVELGWPPNLITMLVQERQPAIIWSEAGNETWIDIQGRIMPARAAMPDVIRVNVAVDAFQGPAATLTDLKKLDKDVVLGALRLQEFLPPGADLDYDPINGLGWTNEQGWQIWMGIDSSAGMSRKINEYQAYVNNLNSRGIEITELNIANPDAPFYKILWGR